MIRDEIKAAQIAAMKAGEKDALGTIRLIQSEIKNKDIEARTSGGVSDDDAHITAVLQKMVKQRRESAEMFAKGGAVDRAAAEEEGTHPHVSAAQASAGISSPDPSTSSSSWLTGMSSSNEAR